MRVFAELGSAVEAAWRRHGRDLTKLPALAMRALSAVDVDAIDPVELAAELVVDPKLPPQLPVPFGDAQVTVWRGKDLLVQLVYWLDGTTAIHQHGFAGAFRVLRGASLHSTYRFVPKRTIDARFRIGKLDRVHQEVLEAGDVRAIGPGRALIHNLIHLVFPSVTLVVRTPFVPALAPQWSYHPPGVAVDPLVDDSEHLARMRLLRTYLRAAPRRTREIGEAMVARGLSDSWDLLVTADLELGERDLERYLRMVRRRHGSDGRLVTEAFVRSRVRMRLFDLRARVRVKQYRTMLALLADGGDRETILDAVHRLYPGGAPTAHIEAWLRGLAEPMGVSLDRRAARVLRRVIEQVPAKAIAAELRGYSLRDVTVLAAAFRRSPLFALLLRPRTRRGP